MSLFKKFTAESDDDKYELPGDEEVKAAVPDEKEEEPMVDEEEPVASNSDKSEEEPITKEEAEVKKTGQRKRNHTPEVLAKKKEKFAELKRRRKEWNEQNKVVFDGEKMTPEEQAAYFWSYVLMENTNDRFAEYGVDHPFTDDYLQSFALPHGDDMLVRRLKEANPDWKRQFVQKKKDGKKGSPTVLIVCMSAIRCTELLKNLSSFGIFIPKLFSKHMKIEEQKKSLQRITPIAIGVPNRILKLADEGVLDLSNVSTLIIDTKENDTKQNVLGQKYTREDLIPFYMKYLHNRVIHKTTKVVLW
ncbi:hypothetical protein WA538_004897 [Blastocystis sp. DL]